MHGIYLVFFLIIQIIQVIPICRTPKKVDEKLRSASFHLSQFIHITITIIFLKFTLQPMCLVLVKASWPWRLLTTDEVSLAHFTKILEKGGG